LFPLFLALADDKAPTPIEPAKLERTEPVDYGKEIAPILQKKCAVCHDGSIAKNNFYVTSYETVVKGGKRGPAVVPGKAGESRLYQFASHSKKPIMPPDDEGDDLTPQELAVLKLWIEQGAKAPKKVEARPRPTVALALPPALVKPVRALAMHPTANVLAASRGNQAFLLDAKTGEVTATLVDANLKTPDGKPANAAHISLVESLAFSPDGATLATGSFREVTLWDVEKKTITTRIGGFADKVTAIAWSPDGKYFATAGGAPTEDGEIRLFDASGKPLLDFKSPHSDTVFGLAFSPDSKMLASGGADKFVRVFEIPGGKLLKSFEGHTQHVLDVGWSPDGKRLVSAGADDLIKIWNYETGEKARDLKGATKQVTRLAFIGKTANFLTVGGDATTRRWSVESGDPSKTFGEAKDFLYAVAANADGTLIATGGEEGIVRIFDGKTGQMIKALNLEQDK
jgi:WD40 repeat protein